MIVGQYVRAGSQDTPMGRAAVARANREARASRVASSEAGSHFIGLINAGLSSAEAAAVVNREAIPLRLAQARENVEIAREMLADAEAELTEAEAAAQAVTP